MKGWAGFIVVLLLSIPINEAVSVSVERSIPKEIDKKVADKNFIITLQLSVDNEGKQVAKTMVKCPKMQGIIGTPYVFDDDSLTPTVQIKHRPAAKLKVECDAYVVIKDQPKSQQFSIEKELIITNNPFGEVDAASSQKIREVEEKIEKVKNSVKKFEKIVTIFGTWCTVAKAIGTVNAMIQQLKQAMYFFLGGAEHACLLLTAGAGACKIKVRELWTKLCKVSSKIHGIVNSLIWPTGFFGSGINIVGMITKWGCTIFFDCMLASMDAFAAITTQPLKEMLQGKLSSRVEKFFAKEKAPTTTTVQTQNTAAKQNTKTQQNSKSAASQTGEAAGTGSRAVTEAGTTTTSADGTQTTTFSDGSKIVTKGDSSVVVMPDGTERPMGRTEATGTSINAGAGGESSNIHETDSTSTYSDKVSRVTGTSGATYLKVINTAGTLYADPRTGLYLSPDEEKAEGLIPNKVTGRATSQITGKVAGDVTTTGAQGKGATSGQQWGKYSQEQGISDTAPRTSSALTSATSSSIREGALTSTPRPGNNVPQDALGAQAVTPTAESQAPARAYSDAAATEPSMTSKSAPGSDAASSAGQQKQPFFASASAEIKSTFDFKGSYEASKAQAQTGGLVYVPVGHKWQAQAKQTTMQMFTGSLNFWDPYMSIHYAYVSMCIPAIAFNLKKDLQIKCLYRNCLKHQAKSRLSLDACDKAYQQRECLYVESATFKKYQYKVPDFWKKTGIAILKQAALFIAGELWQGTCGTMYPNTCEIALGSGVLPGGLKPVMCGLVGSALLIKEITDASKSKFGAGQYEPDQLGNQDFCANENIVMGEVGGFFIPIDSLMAGGAG